MLRPTTVTTLGGYVTGWVLLTAFLGPATWLGVEIRRWLLPVWRGPWARLSEGVVAAVWVLLAVEALGTIGAFDRVGLVVAGVAAAALALVWRRLGRRPSAPPVKTHARVDGATVVAGAVVLGAVAAQWVCWTAQALRRGMTAYDALFYHGPITARFAQTGDLTRLHPIVPGEAVTFYPATTEAWHAIGIVAFRSDVATPLLNLVAFAVAALAAWCLGRRFGGTAAALAGVALVSAMPYIAVSQPGSSFNDMAALAALLAAAALFSQAAAIPAAGLVGALAAGLAAGIKLSFAAPAVLVGLVACWLLPRGRRLVTGAAWAVVIAITGGYWYVRNLVRVGNPMPGIGLGLPSPSLPVDARYGSRLLTSLDLSATGWRTLYRHGLQDYFGRAWPGMAALLVVSIVVGFAVRRRSPWHSALAATVLLALVAYMVTPVTGDPAFFAFNLRYTLPAQGLAVVLVATHPWLRTKWAQRGLILLAGAGIAAAWPGPARGADPFEVAGWPTAERLAAIAVTAAVAGLAVALWALSRHTRVAWVIGVVLAVGLVVAGRGVDDRYMANRYRHLGGELGAAWGWAQGLSHARIGVVGLYQQYPFTGAHIDNYVQYVGVATPHGGLARAPTCPAWRSAVNAGRYGFVVTSREGIFPPPGEPPEAAWTRRDPAAHEIQHTGDTAVFRITGPMHPQSC